MNNNKAYWEALIRGLTWPGEKKKSYAGWYVLVAATCGFLLLSTLV